MKMPKEVINRIISLDLAKKDAKGCCLTEEKNFQDKRMFKIEMSPEGRTGFIASLEAGDLVVMEGGTASYNFAREIMQDGKAEVVVLNPAKLHIIFRSQCKTDKQDAVKIAYYIRDTKRENWAVLEVPSKEQSALRSVINAYNSAKTERTRSINKLHALFNHAGFPLLKKKDLATNEARIEAITALLEGVDLELALIEENTITTIESKIERYEQMMRQALLDNPRETLIWMSIPGISFKTAAALLAYVGDGKRFDNAEQLRNYIGMVPRIDQSGEKCHMGKISSFGCRPVRRNLIQGAWSTRNLSFECTIKDKLLSLLERGKNKQKAQVAVANKMLTIGWSLLKSGELYDATPIKVLKRKLRESKLEAIDCCFFPQLY